MYWMMIGPPGSGKSTVARKFEKLMPKSVKVVSRDECRAIIAAKHGKKLSSSESQDNYFKYEKEVYQYYINRAKMAHDECPIVILDATNLFIKGRKKVIHDLGTKPYNVGYLIMRTPYEICKKQNHNRENVVPDEIFEKMFNNFQEPTNEEREKVGMIYNVMKGENENVGKWLFEEYGTCRTHCVSESD